MATTNTIPSGLQLQTVLNSALTAFRRSILPLTSLSTSFGTVPLNGTDTVVVPYYPLNTNTSQVRAEAGSYKALAGNTTTSSKTVTLNKNKLQAISWTSETANRQPAFNPEKHGELMGQKLAYDVIRDIFSVVTANNFSGSTISASTAANFDVSDVKDLAQKCMEAEWPEIGRSLILNPAFHYNLVNQSQVIDASAAGSDQALREAMVRRIMGFDEWGTNGIPTNNGDDITGTATASSDVVTAGAAHGLAVGDQVAFTVLSLGGGLSLDTRYFVKTVPSSTTLTLSATNGGSTVNISSDYSAVTFAKAEGIAGIACLPSAILAAFAPIVPSAAMQRQMADYQIVTDPDSQIVLEYSHLVYPDTREEVQVIECHYGYSVGESAALKRIVTALS